VTASKAIHEALAAAELTTDDRTLRLFFAEVSEFAKIASTIDQTFEGGVRFSIYD
jgi:hypothetical protein